jgi:hypothetical protein
VSVLIQEDIFLMLANVDSFKLVNLQEKEMIKPFEQQIL